MTQRFRHLFDSLVDEVVVLDQDLRIVYANPAWLRRVGLSASQVLGQPCHEIRHGLQSPCPASKCTIQQTLQTGQPTRVTHASYELPNAAWSDLSVSPVFDSSGQVVEAIAIHRTLMLPPTIREHPEPAPQKSLAVLQEVVDALHTAISIANSGQGLAAVLESLLVQLGRVVDYDSASIALLEERGWRIIAGRGFPEGVDVIGMLFPPDDEKVARLERTKQPMVIGDVQQEPSWWIAPGLEYIRSWIGAPLFSHGSMIGILSLDKATPGYYRTEDAHLVMAFANQVAVVVENARLLEAERERAAQLQLIRDISHQVLSILDPEELLQQAVEAIQRHFGYYFVSVLLVDEAGNDLIAVANSRSFEPESGKGTEHPPRFRIGREGITGHVAANGQPYVAGDVRQDPFYVADEHLPDVRSEMVVPIMVGERVVGVLEIDSDHLDAFDEDSLFIAQSLANQLAIGLENARLFESTTRRVAELEAVHEASLVVTSSLDLQKVLNVILEKTVELSPGVQDAHIFLYRNGKLCSGTALWVDGRQAAPWAEPRPEGLAYTVAQRGEMILVPDTHHHPLLADAPDDWEGSIVGLPLKIGERVVGVMTVAYQLPRSLPEAEMRVLRLLADQAAIAIENARLFDLEHQNRLKLQSIQATATSLSMELRLDVLLDRIVTEAAQAFEAEACSLMLWDQKQECLFIQASAGLSEEYVRQQRITRQTVEATIGPMGERFRPFYEPDLTKRAFGDQNLVRQEGIRSLLSIPFGRQGQVDGVLNIYSKGRIRHFTPAETELAEAFAAYAAVMIANARLYQETEARAQEMAALAAMGQAATSLDLDQVLHRGLAALVGIRNFERVHVMLLDRSRGDLWMHPALQDLFPHREPYRIPLGKGICGQVAQTGKPLRIGDVRQFPGYIVGYPDTRSEMGVPLLAGNRVIGVLDVQSTRLNAFSESDERFLVTLAGQLSTVLENTRLFRESQQRVRELTALTQVSQALNKAADLSTILDIVLEESFALLDSEEASIILIDPPGSNRLRIVAERGLGRNVVEAFNNRPVYTHEGTYRRALTTGRIVQVPDTRTDAEFLRDVGSRATAVTNIPLVTERGAIGLIAIGGLPQDDTTRRLLMALADMAAVAIDKERLRLETASRLSEVTTLYTLATQIASSLSLETVLESIVTILKLTLDCRACCIFLLDDNGEYLQLEAESGLEQKWKGVARMRIGEGISGQAIARQQLIYVPDTHLEPDFLYFDPGIRSLLVAPLVVRNKAIGTLSIDDKRPNAFDDEGRLLTIAAAQAAVAIENARLYEGLQKSYASLAQAYDELRELDRLKSEFVQNISHELRTPLTFIKGYVELLQDGELGELSPEQQSAVDIVAAKAEMLARLVDDILSLQQAGRRRQTFERLDLTEIGRMAVQAAQAAAAEAGITLQDEIPATLPPVQGNRQWLIQVFDNLLGNALKFSDPGDRVTVRMFQQDDAIRTEIEDTGIGIPADQLHRIFDRFYQGGGKTTRRYGGTGLGLAIVKQIVESHGGQVGAESRLGKGSLFHFTIPIAGVEAQSPAQKEPTSQARSPGE